jgi:hypothetical protein
MCFGLEWFKEVLILAIVVCAVISLLRLLVSFVLPKLGLTGEIVGFIVQAATIIFWAIICIVAVIFIFDLIACILPAIKLPQLR